MVKIIPGFLLFFASVLFPVFCPLAAELPEILKGKHWDISLSLKDFPVPSAPAPGGGPVFHASNFTGFPAFAFSDDVNICDLIVRAIDSSDKTIEIASFGISLEEIAQALVKAKNRGVNVRIIMDEKQVHPNPKGEMRFLIDNGVNMRTLRGTRTYGAMHNKIGIFDNRMIVTGSYNWSGYATYYNYENVVFTKRPVYVNGYKKYWDWMWNYSRTLSQGPSPEVPQGHYGAPPAGRRYKDFNGVKLPAYSFSPLGWTHSKLAAIVDAAKENIDLATYTFYDFGLAEALIRAKERGVKVRILMDKSMAKQTTLTRHVIENGVEFRWRRGRGGGAMHHKFAVFDGKLLETGSYNWSWNAEVNTFENVMFIDDSAVVGGYQQKYDYLYSGAVGPSPDEFTALPDYDNDKSTPVFSTESLEIVE